MFKCLTFVYFVVILMEFVDTNKQSKGVTFLHTQVVFNPTYLEEFSFTINRDRTSIDVVLNVAQNFSHDMWIDFSLATKRSKKENYRSLINYDMNMCVVLNKDAEQNLALIWLNNFWKYGTLPKTCPFLKGKYFWHDFKADKINIPAFLLHGKYRVNSKSYFRMSKTVGHFIKDSIANVTLFVLVK